MATIGADSESGCAAPRIETPRLILRAVTLADAPWIERYVSDWDIARHTARIPHPYPPGGAVDFVRSLDPKDGPTFVIERREDREPVGLIGLELEGPGEAEIGFWIGKPFWRRGYASEAMAALVEHAFRKMGLASLIALAVPENRASIRAVPGKGPPGHSTGAIFLIIPMPQHQAFSMSVNTALFVYRPLYCNPQYVCSGIRRSYGPYQNRHADLSDRPEPEGGITHRGSRGAPLHREHDRGLDSRPLRAARHCHSCIRAR